MSTDWQWDIKEFHRAMGHYIGEKPSLPPLEVQHLRSNLIEEEIQETLHALFEEDLVGIADGVADSIVVLLGTVISYGIDLGPIWEEVHRTNMAKLGGDVREDGKSLKPEGWEPPDIDMLLRLQGWEE